MALIDLLANDYIRAGLIMLFVLVVLRPTLFFLEKIVLIFTSKTKTDLDDLLVKRAYKPVASLLVLIGLFIAVQELTLSDNAQWVLQHLIHSAMAVVIAYGIYAFFDVVIVHAIQKHTAENADNTKKSFITLILSILRVLFFILGLVYILTIWGLAIGPFVAGLGIAGLAVALALQPTLANIFSGMGMILDKTIKEGDLVYLDEKTKGKIHKIGMRSTKIISFDNEFIIMPNSKLAESRIQNVSLPDPSARTVIRFMVAYGSDVEQVKKLILDQIKLIPNVLDKPKPIVRLTEMQATGLEFKLYFYVDFYENRFTAIDHANSRIYSTLFANGMYSPAAAVAAHVTKAKTGLAANISIPKIKSISSVKHATKTKKL